MTATIPAVTLPDAGIGRDLTGHPPAPGLLVIMAGPAAPPPGPRRQSAPPRRPGDRSGLWLRNAAAGLCVLAAAAAAVSFTANGGLGYSELSEYPARATESSHADPFSSSMRLKRALRSPRPSGGRILHQKGWFRRHAWSDGRYWKVRKAIPTPL